MHAYQEEPKPQDAFLPEDEPEEELPEQERPNIVRNEDGSFQWVYKMDMKKNHHLLHMILAMILIPSFLLFGGMCLFILMQGTPLSEVMEAMRIIVLCLMVVAVICVFSYKLVSLASGGTDTMVYKMDETGIGLSASGRASKSIFRNVRTVRADYEHHYIGLNSWFLYNMIYCEPEDYEFVLGYIAERCTNAKIHVQH